MVLGGFNVGIGRRDESRSMELMEGERTNKPHSALYCDIFKRNKDEFQGKIGAGKWKHTRSSPMPARLKVDPGPKGV